MSEVDKHAQENISRILVGNKKDLEEQRQVPYNEAKDLAIVLKAGALPAPVEIIESSVVGPSLGADSIQKGLTSSFIALLLVVIFIGIYYRLSGVIADVALIFNLFFLPRLLSQPLSHGASLLSCARWVGIHCSRC